MKNKFGLSRFIQKKIQKQIIKEAGYGCIYCGCILYDFEHIDPEFKDAKIHDPDKMTILCLDHHGKKTRNHISSEMILKQKAKPFCLNGGNPNYHILLNSQNCEIFLGSNKLENPTSIIEIHGEKLFHIKYYKNSENEKSLMLFLKIKNKNNEILCEVFENIIKIKKQDVQIFYNKTVYTFTYKNKVVLEFDLNKGKIIIKKCSFWNRGENYEFNNDNFLINKNIKVNFSNNRFINCGPLVSVQNKKPPYLR